MSGGSFTLINNLYYESMQVEVPVAISNLRHIKYV